MDNFKLDEQARNYQDCFSSYKLARMVVELRNELGYFVDRVEEGSIRSKTTYERYCEKLEQTALK